MSRSYRKNPIIKDNKRGSKTAKAHANRLFRRCSSNDELRIGKSAVHRKFTESWNIHDYVSRWTRSKAEREWHYQLQILIFYQKIQDQRKLHELLGKMCEKKVGSK